MKILYSMPHTSTGGMPKFALKRIQAMLKFQDEFELFVVEYSNISDEFVVQKNQIRFISMSIRFQKQKSQEVVICVLFRQVIPAYL